MKYRDIQKGETYHDRKVTAIYPAGSNWAGPGLDWPTSSGDDVAYQDYREGVRTSCTAVEFARWCTVQERKRR